MDVLNRTQMKSINTQNILETNFTPPHPLKTAVLFMVFNRPDTTNQVFEAIRKARPPRLYIAADGARIDKIGEAENVFQVRHIVSQVDWVCEVKTLFRDLNLGCRKSVSSALDWFFESEEEGIILEDDCLPSQSFFWFCELLLEFYRSDMRIMHIGGCNFQNGIKRGSGSYYFSKFNHVWGWGSWRRAWLHFDVAMQTFPYFLEIDQIKNIWPDKKMQKFWLKIFQDVFKGKIDTWDYQWTYAIWMQNGISVIPNINMISNIGFDERATHTKCVSGVSNMRSNDLGEMIHPIFVLADTDADNYTFESNSLEPLYKRIINGIARRIRRSIKIIK